jgi:hypothetical protein
MADLSMIVARRASITMRLPATTVPRSSSDSLTKDPDGTQRPTGTGG